MHLEVAAPAKINLGLRIVGRRANGYHELESLFVPLDLADALRLDVREARKPRVALVLQGGLDGGGVPGDATNLAARAAAGFLAASGLTLEIEMVLTKHTPAAAGLGGGSSDAAAVLRALSEAFPAAVDPPGLAGLALELGADVPFFLDPRPTWVRGVGEVLEPAAGVPSLALLLANPGLSVATAEVYRAFDALHPEGVGQAGAPRLPDWSDPRGDADALAALLHNDLEGPAVRLCPPIARLREKLRALEPAAVGMSGSGATVFGVYEDVESARRALAEARSDARLGDGTWARVAVTGESR